jgi:hypothetical protein
MSDSLKLIVAGVLLVLLLEGCVTTRQAIEIYGRATHLAASCQAHFDGGASRAMSRAIRHAPDGSRRQTRA